MVGETEIWFTVATGTVLAGAVVCLIYQESGYSYSVAVATGAGILLFLLWVPLLQVNKIEGISAEGTAKLVNEYRATWAGVIGGAGFFAGVLVAWRHANAALRTAEAALRSAQIAEQGQITDRFTRAIDQIGKRTADGHPNVEVRLGGVYALEQIVNDVLDQQRERYLSQVAAVLVSYVQENAKPGSAVDGKVRNDVQAAVAVIGRLVRFPISRIGLVWLDFSNLELPGLDLSGFNTPMMEWRFDGSNLVGAQFVSSKMSLHAINANLKGANLSSAVLTMAILREANLTSAWLISTNLSGGMLEKALLNQANCPGLRLEHARLHGANLSGARIHRYQLCEAEFDKDTVLPDESSGLNMKQVCEQGTGGGFLDDKS